MSIISSVRNVITRAVMPKVFQNWSDPDILIRKREENEKLRQKEGRPHEVFYFHEIADPYSYITAHILSKFKEEYAVELVPLIVGEPPTKTIHEPSMYRNYCLTDGIRIAPFYGVNFTNKKLPKDKLISLSQRILCNIDEETFISLAVQVYQYVWSGNEEALNALINDKTPSIQETSQIISNNEEKRSAVEAYMGSTFSYEGELYWGVDRLNHLEDRLKELGLKKDLNTTLVSERTRSKVEKIPKESNLKLEFYPSLNSPYTYICLERIKAIKTNYPIEVVTRPVLPMLMRNMTIPNYKGKYIFKDSAREARRYGVPFGKVMSPLGKPAERAYSLFPWVDHQGKGFEYICSLMISAFRKAEAIGKKSYLKALIEDLDLDWLEAKKHLDSDDWKEVLENNRLTMYEGDCWGVPSFRIIDGKDSFTTWGQDRIWLLEEEIIKRLNNL